MRISLFDSEKDNSPKALEISFEELSKNFDEPNRRAQKSGEAWSPASFNGTRKKEHVKSLACLVFDLDEPLTDALCRKLLAYNCIIHGTWSEDCWRVILETTREFSPAEHTRLWPLVRSKLGANFDPACTDASRLYFTPARPEGASYEKFESLTGKPVDVDALLATVDLYSRPTAPPAPAKLAAAPAPTKAYSVDEYVAQIKAAKGGDPELKKLAVDLLQNKLDSTARGRDTTAHRAFCGLATFTDVPPPKEFVHVLIEQHMTTFDPMPEGVAHWRKTLRNQYEKAFEHKNKQLEERKAINAAFVESLAPDDREWRKQLIGKKDDNGNFDSYAPIGPNVITILSNHPDFKGLRFDIIENTFVVDEGSPIHGVSLDTIDSVLADWFTRSEFKIKMPRAEVLARFYQILETRRFDPLQEYLKSLVWDGVPRISSILREKCNVSMHSDFYIEQVSRKFFISAARRALNPGTQVDTMLVLEGEGGTGKTSFIRALGGRFAGETTLHISDKDATMGLTCKWLVEQAELSAMKKADRETFRAFVTKTVDEFRPPYGRAIRKFPRRCVFIGTTNDDQPLNDRAGARRYWPVHAGKIEWEWLAANRDQLWAEAVVAANSGEAHWFTEEERIRIAPEVDGFQATAPMTEEIQNWFLSKPFDKRPAQVTVSEILEKVGFHDAERRTMRQNQIACGEALKGLGFNKSRKMVNGLRSHYWDTPQNMLQGKMSASAVLVQVKKTDESANG